MNYDTTRRTLRRELGVFGATMMGLGAMVGTGIFVSIGIAAGAAGPAVLLAIGLAALVAMCNAFSSAQLAASHSVSGGTYEYGYRYLNPWLGFTAGWMFLCAKSASAATAALGFAGYFSLLVGLDASAMMPLAVGAVAVLTVLVLLGIRRSNWTNIAVVGITLTALGFFVLSGFPELLRNGRDNLVPFFPADGAAPVSGFFYATPLMFVAYTGYARIATLGLVYYTITNLAALRLPQEALLYSRAFPVGGLVGCAFLAWWVPPRIWLTGCALILVGVAWHVLARRRWAPRAPVDA